MSRDDNRDGPGDGPSAGLADLPVELRAATVAAVLHAGSAASRVLARIDGGAAGVAAAGALFAGERDRRAALLAAAVVELRAPVPRGLDAVHEEWLRGPDGEGAGPGDPRVAAALASDAPSADPAVRTWLERRRYGHLVAMPGIDARGIDALARVEPQVLVQAIAVWGRRTLATASVAAPHEHIAQLAARLGDRHAASFIAEVAAAVAAAAEPGPGARLVHRALAGAAVSSRGLASIGLERLAVLLRSCGGDRVRQVAQRLPRELGAELIARSGAGGASGERPAAVGADRDAELSSFLECFGGASGSEQPV